MVYIMSKRAMMAFYQRAYDEGIRIGFEAGKRWAQNKGVVIASIPHDPLNPKFRQDIDDILKGKGV